MKDPRCESKGHSNCYGEIWTCEKCGKRICSNEGADDEHFYLCDECAFNIERRVAMKDRAIEVILTVLEFLARCFGLVPIEDAEALATIPIPYEV